MWFCVWLFFAPIFGQTYPGTNASAGIRFPPHFVWGAATAAFQIEGAYEQYGRGLSIWDTFCLDPTKCSGDNGNVACDHYNRIEEDVQLIKNLEIGAYRMSLSWSRLLPEGTGTPNQKGIDHYNRELDALLEAGIQPFVTLYHWDLPQALEDKGGWLNPTTIDAFVEYAKLAFTHFGDRVKNWATFNEPYVVSQLGYGLGIHAPGRCSNRTQCPFGNSSTEPYLVGHNLLLSHGKAAALYRSDYKADQKGKIGIAINSDWAIPLNETDPEDQDAAERWLQFTCGWFADPVYTGDYPLMMRQRLGDRLPNFTQEEREFLKDSVDVFYLNHYTTVYATNPQGPLPEGWDADTDVKTTRFRDGVPLGPVADSEWLYVYPQGLRKLLSWISKRYSAPIIMITENGVDVPGESNMDLEQALDDVFRIEYFGGYLAEVSNAIFQDGVLVQGYFAWSLLDNFEWADGYDKRFGLHYVDYQNNLTRYPKRSADYFTSIINYNKRLVWHWLIGIGLVVLAVIGFIVTSYLRREKSASSGYEVVE